MTLRNGIPEPPGAMTADTGTLVRAAAGMDDVAAQLTSGAGAAGTPAVLPAPVPQAAALTAALEHIRDHQRTVVDGFARFYRDSAASLRATAGQLQDGEATSAGVFHSLGGGGGA